MRKSLLTCLLCLVPVAQGQTAPDVPASCKVLYSMIEEDTLHNVNQGLIASGFKEKDGLKWLEKMYKKYPDVCYVAPNSSESVVFVIIATPAVYHGTRVENSSHAVTNSSGQAETDDEGNTIQTTSSVAVPYEVNYSSFTLTIERKTADGHFEPVRRFKVDGLYHWAYGMSWGKGKHPVANVMEDAIKWIHEGGLNNPAQTIAP
ncbi:MAG: hypothetical protein ABSE45_13435 [Candidatus Acidiferrales bacterium]|jgi:hypothetical protein